MTNLITIENSPGITPNLAVSFSEILRRCAKCHHRILHRDWIKKMSDEGWLFLEKTIIGDKTVTRNKPNGKVASIALLSEKGQKHARKLDDRIGKRISRPNQQQSRHALIVARVAIYLINGRSDLQVRSRDYFEIWSDQVLRGIKVEKI